MKNLLITNGPVSIMEYFYVSIVHKFTEIWYYFYHYKQLFYNTNKNFRKGDKHFFCEIS